MHKTYNTLKGLLMVSMLFFYGCDGPELPEVSDIKSAPELVAAVCDGAAVGKVEMQNQVKMCTGSKRYFDRNANEGLGFCTEKRIAGFGCTLAGLNTILNAKAKAELEEQLESRLKNFLIDQCYEDVNDQNLPIYTCTFEDGDENSTQEIFFSRS